MTVRVVGKVRAVYRSPSSQYLVQNNDNFIMRTQLEGLYLHMKVSRPVMPSL